MREQSLLIVRYTVTYLQRRVDLRTGAFERSEGVELRDRDGVSHPGEELFVGDDPDILLFLSPVQESVNHIDRGFRRIDTRISGGSVDGVSVEPNRLPITIIVSSERILHIL